MIVYFDPVLVMKTKLAHFGGEYTFKSPRKINVSPVSCLVLNPVSQKKIHQVGSSSSAVRVNVCTAVRLSVQKLDITPTILDHV